MISALNRGVSCSHGMGSSEALDQPASQARASTHQETRTPVSAGANDTLVRRFGVTRGTANLEQGCDKRQQIDGLRLCIQFYPAPKGALHVHATLWPGSFHGGVRPFLLKHLALILWSPVPGHRATLVLHNWIGVVATGADLESIHSGFECLPRTKAKIARSRRCTATDCQRAVRGDRLILLGHGATGSALLCAVV